MRESFRPFSCSTSAASLSCRAPQTDVAIGSRSGAPLTQQPCQAALGAELRRSCKTSKAPLTKREKAPLPLSFQIEAAAPKSDIEHFSFPRRFVLSRSNADLDSYCQGLLEYPDVYRYVFVCMPAVAGSCGPALASGLRYDYVLLSTLTTGLLCLHELGGEGLSHFYKLLKSGSVVKYGWTECSAFAFCVKPYVDLSLFYQLIQYSPSLEADPALVLPPELVALHTADLQAYSRRNSMLSRQELLRGVSSFYHAIKCFRDLVREAQPGLWSWCAEEESAFAAYYCTRQGASAAQGS